MEQLTRSLDAGQTLEDADLGTERSHRILRTSPLTPVPPAC
jgi:hypothetical protein